MLSVCFLTICSPGGLDLWGLNLRLRRAECMSIQWNIIRSWLNTVAPLSAGSQSNRRLAIHNL